MGADAQKITTDVTGNDTAGMSVDEHSNTLKTLDEVKWSTVYSSV